MIGTSIFSVLTALTMTPLPHCDESALIEFSTSIVTAANRGDEVQFAALVSEDVVWSIATADTWVAAIPAERVVNRYVEPIGDARDQLRDWFGGQNFSHAIAKRALSMVCIVEGGEFELEFASGDSTQSVVLNFRIESNRLTELRGLTVESRQIPLQD